MLRFAEIALTQRENEQVQASYNGQSRLESHISQAAAFLGLGEKEYDPKPEYIMYAINKYQEILQMLKEEKLSWNEEFELDEISGSMNYLEMKRAIIGKIQRSLKVYYT